MKTEYEVRVLEIDRDKMIETLESLGAQKIGDWHQKRYVYDIIPKDDNSWIRLRTNGIKTTLTFKTVKEKTIDGTKEAEVEVSDFEETNLILEQMGHHNRGFQENKRIQYILDDVEFDIDSWPYIPTYLEIEGKNEESVKNMMDLLEVDKTKATSLDVQGVFKEFYNIDIAEVPVVKFDEPLDKKYYIN